MLGGVISDLVSAWAPTSRASSVAPARRRGSRIDTTIDTTTPLAHEKALLSHR